LFTTTKSINNEELVDQLSKLGLLCSLMDAQTVRFVTHLDVSNKDILKAINILNSLGKV
jgi:threonine aldolase